MRNIAGSFSRRREPAPCWASAGLGLTRHFDVSRELRPGPDSGELAGPGRPSSPDITGSLGCSLVWDSSAGGREVPLTPGTFKYHVMVATTDQSV